MHFPWGDPPNLCNMLHSFGHSASLAGDADRQDDLLLCVLPLGVRGDPSIADKGGSLCRRIEESPGCPCPGPGRRGAGCGFGWSSCAISASVAATLSCRLTIFSMTASRDASSGGRQQRPGVPLRQMAGPQPADRGAELQQARLAAELALANACCCLLLAQPIAADELGQTCGLFQIVQILALEILHQGDEAGLGVSPGPAGRRGRCAAPASLATRAPLPDQTLIAVGPAPRPTALKHAVLADACGQLLQGHLVKIRRGCAGLGRSSSTGRKMMRPDSGQYFVFGFATRVPPVFIS